MPKPSAIADFSAFAEAFLIAAAASGRDRAPAAFFLSGDSGSSIEKHSRVLHKETRVLEQRPVARFRIDDELRIRDVLRHDKGVHSRKHDVAVAVYHERRLHDSRQFIISTGPIVVPRAKRGSLSLARLRRTRRIDVNCAFVATCPKLPPGFLALGRRIKEQE